MNVELDMCLITVYIDSGAGQKEFMRDIARLEAEAEGFSLIDLFGTRKSVRGKLKSIDFIDEHAVVLEQNCDKSKPCMRGKVEKSP
jgi:predicted RNA-binding protein